MLEHERLLLTRKYEEAMKRMTRQVKEIETREKELKQRLKERESAKKRISVLEENVRTLRLDRDQLKAALVKKTPHNAAAVRVASAPTTGRGQPMAAGVFFSRYQEERERILQRRATTATEIDKLQNQMKNLVKFMTTHCGVEQVFVDALLVSQNQFP
jgi:DNA repair exonuclease SbcCD ATPase subunit